MFLAPSPPRRRSGIEIPLPKAPAAGKRGAGRTPLGRRVRYERFGALVRQFALAPSLEPPAQKSRSSRLQSKRAGRALRTDREATGCPRPTPPPPVAGRRAGG